MNTITNTTVLSNFAAIGQLKLLRQLFPELYLPTEVYEEINTGLADGYEFYTSLVGLIHPFNPDGWLKLATFSNDAELKDLAKLPTTLHAGECACLVIARHRGWLLLTDDRAARRQAVRWEIRLSGTLGCLVLAVERSHCTLTEANAHLHQMIQAGYRSPYTELLPLLGK